MFLILHTTNSTASLGDKAVCGMLGWYVARSASLSLSLYASLAGFLVYLLEILGEKTKTSILLVITTTAVFTSAADD